MTFDTFQKLIEALAARKGCSTEELTSQIVAAKPANSGTQAEPNKFHDDKELYTGVHKCAAAADPLASFVSSCSSQIQACLLTPDQTHGWQCCQ